MFGKITSIFKRKKADPVSTAYPYILSVGGAIGLVAMTWQAAERITMLKNPAVDLSCSLSPVVDCTGVLGNKLAAVLGFPNAFLGMIFFAILATSGLMLLSGGAFKSWFRHFVMAVSIVLILFSVWFFSVSLYILGTICIFCVFGWIVAVPMFWYGLLYYLQSASKKTQKKLARFISFGRKHHFDVVVVVYGIMILMFLIRFREFYFS